MKWIREAHRLIQEGNQVPLGFRGDRLIPHSAALDMFPSRIRRELMLVEVGG